MARNRDDFLSAMDAGEPITLDEFGRVAVSDDDIRYLQNYARVRGYQKYDITTDVWTTELDC